MPDAVLPILIGEGETQVVEDVKVDLEPPALEVEEKTFKVKIDQCDVIVNKVLITGRVSVNIVFKTRDARPCSDTTANVSNDVPRIFCGNVRHCTAVVPFSAFIEVPGARPGDDCQIVCVGVEGEVQEEIDTNGDGLIDELRIIFAIVIQIRVTRDEVVLVQGFIRTPLTQPIVFPRRFLS